MCENILCYHGLADFLASNGVTMYGHDHLGHGRSAEAGFGYFADERGDDYLIEDAHILSEEIARRNPGIPHFILGFSLGSFVVRRLMIRYGEQYDGFVIAGSGNLPKSLIGFAIWYAERMIRRHGPKSYSDLVEKRAFGKFNSKFTEPDHPDRWLSHDMLVLTEYQDDPSVGFRFTISAYRDMFKMIRDLVVRKDFERIPKDKPVLLISGKMDPLGDYGSGVEKVERDLNDFGIKTDNRIYPGLRHVILKGEGTEKVRDDLLGWIRSNL